jgi:hypothetical protein
MRVSRFQRARVDGLILRKQLDTIKYVAELRLS